MFPSHLQITKKHWSRNLQRPYVKVKVSRGTQECPLALGGIQAVPERTPGHGAVPHSPCLAQLVFTDMPPGECPLHMHCFTLSTVHTCQERLFISYPSCLCVICQMSHASSASSLCHTGNVTVGCSCFSSWWFTDVLSSLGSHPPEQGRFHLQLKLPTVLSLAWVDRRPPFHGTLLGHPHCCVVVASSSFFLHYQGWT